MMIQHHLRYYLRPLVLPLLLFTQECVCMLIFYRQMWVKVLLFVASLDDTRVFHQWLTTFRYFQGFFFYIFLFDFYIPIENIIYIVRGK